MNNDSTKFDEKYGFQQLNLNLASGQKALLGPDSITVARDPERTLEKPHAVMEGGKEPASEFTKDVFDVTQKTGPEYFRTLQNQIRDCQCEIRNAAHTSNAE